MGQRRHVGARAVQRYGLTVTRDIRKGLVRAIQSHKAIFLTAGSNRTKSFAVSYENTWYAVVYDNSRKEIVTFLPPEYLNRYRSLIHGRQD